MPSKLSHVERVDNIVEYCYWSINCDFNRLWFCSACCLRGLCGYPCPYCSLLPNNVISPTIFWSSTFHFLFKAVSFLPKMAIWRYWATRGVTVSMSAFLACHQCCCAGSSLAWGLNLRAVVCGIFWGSSPGVFSGYSGFLPSFIGLMVQPIK